MPKTQEITDLTESQNLPDNIRQTVSQAIIIADKLEQIKTKEAQLKSAKEKIVQLQEKCNSVLLKFHKEAGDFTIGDFTVKKSTTFSTEIVDEAKLPASCYVLKQEKVVTKAKVKELILDGTIPREVAYQKKKESIKIK